MPELKHHFRAGKMNKDLDERLVPDGEYRDALNIEVASSDASDVGAVFVLFAVAFAAVFFGRRRCCCQVRVLLFCCQCC